MHYLDRTPVAVPACLRRYGHGQNNWEDLSPADREEIRAALEVMQSPRCAYCECRLKEHNQHIEHFRQRSRYPQGTFEWANLFWSCTSGVSCGKHKDGCGPYDHTDLIKPDVEDPEQFFLFVVDGSIAVRTGLTDAQQHRAAETLRIFNLDAQWGPLRRIRYAAVRGYVTTAEEIQEMASTYPLRDWMPFLEDELEQIRDLPFCTAIKHALTPQGVTE